MEFAIRFYTIPMVNDLRWKIQYYTAKVMQMLSAVPNQESGIRMVDTRCAAGYNVERVLERYGNSILRLAYSYLHNLSDAEDILQETLIKYISAAPAFENEYHEKAWLFKVAVNLSKNRIQYNALRKTDELEETLAAEEREDLSFIWDAVKKLPENYREVIHLFYYEGYKTAEIAEILHKKESTVRSDLKRGREKLKTVLREVYDFE